MTGAVGLFHHGLAGTVNHIEAVIDQCLDQLWCRVDVIGVVAIDHHIDVSIDISEHPAHDKALSLTFLPAHDRTGTLSLADRIIGGVVVVNKDP